VWKYGGRNGKDSREWKAAKPRCFKKLKIYNLPLVWRNNKKTFMTAKMKKMPSFFLQVLPATQR
jgi:hypothetical protein